MQFYFGEDGKTKYIKLLDVGEAVVIDDLLPERFRDITNTDGDLWPELERLLKAASIQARKVESLLTKNIENSESMRQDYLDLGLMDAKGITDTARLQRLFELAAEFLERLLPQPVVKSYLCGDNDLDFVKRYQNMPHGIDDLKPEENKYYEFHQLLFPPELQKT